MIRPYLRDIINDHKTQTEWKIQLIIIIDFISSKNSNKICTKSNNIEIMMVMKQMKLLKNFLNLFCKYIKKDEKKKRGSEFVFDSVDLLYCNLHKIAGSYLDSPKWLKTEKATINPKNNDDKCFQYVALNYQNIKNNPEGLSKIKPFIEQYDWKEIDFPSHKQGWKKSG